MIEIALFFMAESFAVGDEVLKIARVRLIDRGIVKFVHNAVAQREPHPATRVISSAESFLGTRRPPWRDARRAECDGMLDRIHGAPLGITFEADKLDLLP
jgi:hypothetical protein